MVELTRNAVVAIVVAIAVVAVAAGAVVLLQPKKGAATNCTPPPPTGFSGAYSYVMVACDTSVKLGANSYVAYSVARLSDGEILVGELTVNSTDPGSVNAYLLNSTELGQLEGNPHITGPPSSNWWSSGSVRLCNLSVEVPPSPAQYSLVVENVGSSSIHFVWTKTLMFYYDSTA
jgi:hypothetical protein